MKFVWSQSIIEAKAAADRMEAELRLARVQIEEMQVQEVCAILGARGVVIGDRVDVVRQNKMWNSDEVKEVRETGIFTHVERGRFRVEPNIAKIKADGSASTRKLHLSHGSEIVPVGAPFPAARPTTPGTGEGKAEGGIWSL